LCSEFIVNYLLVIEETSMVLGNAHLLLVPWTANAIHK
jgi:hypothetical protein